MNATTAICNHSTPACGSPYSFARFECENTLCLRCQESYTLIHTFAPVGYDGFGTKIVKQFSGEINGKHLRAVMIRNEHLDWQTQRYLSGLQEAIGVNWYFRWVQNGMIKYEWLEELKAKG